MAAMQTTSRIALKAFATAGVLAGTIALSACGGSAQSAPSPAASTSTASPVGSSSVVTASAATATGAAKPEDAATPMPSWAASIGMPSMTATTTLTDTETCKVYLAVFKAHPSSSVNSDAAGSKYFAAIRDDWGQVLPHVPANLKSDADFIYQTLGDDSAHPDVASVRARGKDLIVHEGNLCKGS